LSHEIHQLVNLCPLHLRQLPQCHFNILHSNSISFEFSTRIYDNMNINIWMIKTHRSTSDSKSSISALRISFCSARRPCCSLIPLSASRNANSN
jgi:hypothetical protein